MKFGYGRITITQSTKYLRLTIRIVFSFVPHIKKIKSKNTELFTRLRSDFGAEWGYDKTNLKILYKTVFIPKIIYAADSWCEANKNIHHIRALYSIQRRGLVAITSCYQTVSSECLPVIAGVLPLVLKAKWQATRANTKLLPPNDRKLARDLSYSDLLNIWQSRWDNSNKSRTTYEYFPSIRRRLEIPLPSLHSSVL